MRCGNSAAGFGDVPAGRFYTEAVQWMTDEGITTGVTPTRFAPHRLVTRNELAVFLYRALGSPAAGTGPFIDVDSGDFFAEAVTWMGEREITHGVTPTTFAPGRPVTRAEVATFLYRLPGAPPVEVDAGGICRLAGEQR